MPTRNDIRWGFRNNRVSFYEFLDTLRRYIRNERWWDNGPASWYMQDDPCVYCGAPSDTWEHLDAVVKGGSTKADNMARACEPCNKQKASLSVLHYLAFKALGRPDEYRVSVKRANKHRGLLRQLERLLAARKNEHNKAA